MIVKKLTDKEIVKAYEHCYVNNGTCKSCCLSDKDKPCVSHEDVLDLIQRQKEEIERLTEENRVVKHNMDFHRNKKFELQKKVDELTDKLGKVLCTVGLDEYRQSKAIEQAVKDTAKEIFEWLEKHCFFNGFEIVETYFKERYGVEVE